MHGYSVPPTFMSRILPWRSLLLTLYQRQQEEGSPSPSPDVKKGRDAVSVALSSTLSPTEDNGAPVPTTGDGGAAGHVEPTTTLMTTAAPTAADDAILLVLQDFHDWGFAVLDTWLVDDDAGEDGAEVTDKAGGAAESRRDEHPRQVVAPSSFAQAASDCINQSTNFFTSPPFLRELCELGSNTVVGYRRWSARPSPHSDSLRLRRHIQRFDVHLPLESAATASAPWLSSLGAEGGKLLQSLRTGGRVTGAAAPLLLDVQRWFTRPPQEIDSEAVFPWPMHLPRFEEAIRRYFVWAHTVALSVVAIAASIEVGHHRGGNEDGGGGAARWCLAPANQGRDEIVYSDGESAYEAQRYTPSVLFLRCATTEPAEVEEYNDDGAVPLDNEEEEGRSLSGVTAGRDAVTAAAHTDSGVLTVIPLGGGGAPGLQCWAQGQWHDVTARVHALLHGDGPLLLQRQEASVPSTNEADDQSSTSPPAVSSVKANDRLREERLCLVFPGEEWSAVFGRSPDVTVRAASAPLAATNNFTTQMDSRLLLSRIAATVHRVVPQPNNNNCPGGGGNEQQVPFLRTTVPFQLRGVRFRGREGRTDPMAPSSACVGGGLSPPSGDHGDHFGGPSRMKVSCMSFYPGSAK